MSFLGAGLLSFVFVLFRPRATEVYDVIVVGAGAGGCTLAQTLAEEGARVVLLERGGEKTQNAKNIVDLGKVLHDECTETLYSGGVTVAAGSCMGGSTSMNQGIFMQPRLAWFHDNIDTDFYSEQELTDAFDWVRQRVSPEPSSEPEGSKSQLYTESLVDAFARNNFTITNIDPGQPELLDGVWRGHTTFAAVTGKRRSADTLLDRNNENLEIRTHAKVSQILFDGDLSIPLTFRYPEGTLPRARCVRLATLETICVKEHGRIYLSTGAFHTPELLMKSGIGRGGRKVDNPNVGQNLVDKPLIGVVGNFQPDFQNDGPITLSHIVATDNVEIDGQSELLLFEDASFGGESLLLDIAAFHRQFLPRSLRDTFYGDAAVRIADWCRAESGLFPSAVNAIGICDSFDAVIEAECDRSSVGLASIVAQPTSRGSVTLSRTGMLLIDVNYMATVRDKKALAHAMRRAFSVLSSMSGPAALERPCDDGEENCNACPNLQRSALHKVKEWLGLISPRAAAQIPSPPVSVVQPHLIEETLKYNDDEIIGDILSQEVFGAQHFAGTAAFGKVVDGNFEVLGVEGLYIADASVLPTTPEVNSMATVMMLGRLAGLKAITEMRKDRE